jgi:pimeloyl-ACP methyl ester carboxylesterase
MMTSLPPPSAIKSVDRFYQAGASVQALRAGLAGAQRLWPSLAVRLAERLFLTPNLQSQKRSQSTWAPHWHIERHPFERASITLYRFQNDDLGDVAFSTGQARPFVLLVHGWGGQAEQLLPLANALHDKGYSPIIVEVPAHGRSRGRTSTLPQFARAIDYVCARLRQREMPIHAVVAHSLGASASAYAHTRGLNTQGLVMIAPADAPHHYSYLFARVFGLTERTRAAMQAKIEAQEAALMDHFDAGRSAPQIKVPTLVIHDTKDAVNAFAGAERFAQLIPSARLYATTGLGHKKILGDAGVHAQIIEFLATLR